MFNFSKLFLKTSLLALLSLAILFTTSCKDDKDSLEDLLTGNDWRLVTLKIGGVGGPAEDCDKDDKLSVHEDGTYTLDEGDLKCDPSDPDVINGTWELDEDAETVTISYDDNGSTVTETQNIVELTKSKMVLSIDVPLFGTIESTYEPF